MATPHACAALVDVFPDVLRLKRTLVTASSVQGSAALAAVAELEHPRVSELAEHLHLDLSTVSRQVAQLRHRGLLGACPDPADGRSQQLTLTDEGRVELRRTRRALVGELAECLSDSDDADVKALVGLLVRISRTSARSAAAHSVHDSTNSSGTSTTTGSALRGVPSDQIQENA